MTEMAWATNVTAFMDERIQAAGTQHREVRQRLPDKQQVGVDLGRTPQAPGPGQTGLRQNTLYSGAVNVQSSGNGADRPFFGYVEFLDLTFYLARKCHGEVLVGS